MLVANKFDVVGHLEINPSAQCYGSQGGAIDFESFSSSFDSFQRLSGRQDDGEDASHESICYSKTASIKKAATELSVAAAVTGNNASLANGFINPMEYLRRFEGHFFSIRYFCHQHGFGA